MAAPDNRYAFSLKIATDAATRWKSRQQARDRKNAAADNGQYTDADSKVHLAEHLNRLLKAVAATAPAGIVARAAQAESMGTAATAPSRAITAADISDQMVERVIGNTRDFLAILFFDKGTVSSRAVCRIVTTLDDGQSFGTGFLVTPRLLITNHHVLTSEDDATRSSAEFNYQLNGANAVLPVESFKLDPASFFLTDVGLDFALVALSPRSATGTPLSSFGFCPLIGATGKIIIGQPVNIVQHPKGDLKQVVIRENKLLDLPDTQPGSDIDQYAHYEADTDPGSSGSPVFNDQWEVIALHHSGIPKTNAQGQPLDRQGNVWPQGGDPDQIDWVANEGIRASRLVDFISNAAITRGKELRDEFVAISHGEVQPAVKPEKLEAPIVPPSKPAADGVAQAHAEAAVQAAPAGAVTFTVPLTVTIGIGAPGAAAMPAVAAAATSMAAPAVGAALESGKPDPNFAARPGFDPNFLGFSAPLPKLMPAVANQAAKVDGSGIELKYFNYSVIMNAARKLAFVSAVNLDAVAKFSAKRVGKDNWYYDDRISHDLQAGKELYADNPLDFGHLTRRQDAGWGATLAAATKANDDTFHLTNCSPQHSIFNQSSLASHEGVLLWGTLENYVTAQAKKDIKKLSIYNGPVFRDNDAPYRGILLPKEFWKMIVYVKDDGKPGAVAFVLSQESLIKNLAAEDFVEGPFKPYQIKVSDLQTRTNLDFGSLGQFDAMHNVANESLFEGARTQTVAINTLDDMVL